MGGGALCISEKLLVRVGTLTNALTQKMDRKSIDKNSNEMGNSLLAVRDINHKYIVVEKIILILYYFYTTTTSLSETRES